jgi:hypothetical protein
METPKTTMVFVKFRGYLWGRVFMGYHINPIPLQMANVQGST